MNPNQLREMLIETLDDYRLTRSEKRALSQVLEHVDPTPQGLALLRSEAFQLARESFNNVVASRVLDWLEEVVKLLQPSDSEDIARAECHFSPGDDCPLRINGLFKTARNSVDVCVFTITDDRITEGILEAHQRGVSLRIITDDEKAFDSGSDISQLERAGVSVRADKSVYHMHHKFAIFDGELLLTGSYNWTRGAAEHNEENFIVTGDRRLISPFAELFERLWRQFG